MDIMMGIFKKRVVEHCPNCGADLPVRVLCIGSYAVRRACYKCGARFEISSDWGNVETHRSWGFRGMPADGLPLPPVDLSKPDGESYKKDSDELHVGNVGYWKTRYGDEWLQVHDDWEHEDNAWWKEHSGHVQVNDEGD